MNEGPPSPQSLNSSGIRNAVDKVRPVPLNSMPSLAFAALFATISYLCYYRAISKIGASKAMALDVTYAAWAIVFTVIILRDFSVLSPLTVTCALTVIICGILSATDFKQLKSKRNKK